MPLRVLQIIPALDQCGAEKQMVMLASSLPRDDFDVHVAALTRSGPLETPLREAGIPLEVIGKRWKLDPSAWLRMRRLIRRLKPDIVHTWLFAANCYGRHAAIWEGVPVIIAGERCVDEWKRGYEFWIDRQLAKRTDRIATNSSGVVEFYANHGLPREKFTVIPNGIDATCVEGGPTKAQLLDEWGAPPDAKLIGTVGRLWPQKRMKDLIWAVELLRSGRGGDTVLAIVGDGPLHDRLQQYIDDTRLNDYVRLVGARNDAANLMPAFDCFWLASGYEGQSNAVMEAMCSGTPVVVSDIAGNRDLVTDDETGWLVPVGDAAAFARKANALFDEPERGVRVAIAAKERMLQEFTVQKMIDRHADLYRNLAAQAEP